ncbi:polysaccharide biosynthesis protein CapD [Flavobacterium frigoris PS1]|uniref:Polysaccharide biosynthesis protein CapD n=1 Tax=Flavobacterium frigoris (strain PS1) TaxID=1086011 RepID=H7FML6_FLAFP|nr:polysaccharide biosynthesis protein CapD [Flavobacterium frigoris PS1]
MSFYDTLPIPVRYGIIVFVNVIFFLWFKTYSGIIRHSSFLDGVKLFFSTSCAFLILVFVNYFSFFVIGKKIYLLPGLFVNYVISFVLLFLFRIFVKSFFEVFKLKEEETGTLRTMIYGSDANAIFVANALQSEIPSRFKLVAFINKAEVNSTKTILGLPILSLKKKIPVLLRSKNAKALILADKSLSVSEKMAIVDLCLDFNFKVFTLPAISDWENQNEISKKVKNIQIEDLLERNPIVLDNKLISKQVKSKTILISGAAGSIGSEIVSQIMSFHPAKIIMVDQAETPLHHLSLELSKLESSIEIHAVIADIRDYEVMKAIFEKYQPKIVYHAAAYKHVPLMEENPAQAIFTNVRGTKNLADLSIKYKVDRFVMVSTDKAVNPSNVMGASKRIAEKYVQSLFYKNVNEGGKGTKFITTRFGNVLGSNGSVVPLFTKQIASGGPVTITHQDIIRYFMTIPEACQLVLEAGSMGNGGEIYIFDMGKPVKIIDLARKMIKLAGFVPDKDIKIQIVGLRPGEKLYEELLNDTSKTLPTHHHKIMIAQETQECFEDLHSDIQDLLDSARLFNNDAIVLKMKQIVPEFKSMNSTFAVLDK